MIISFISIPVLFAAAIASILAGRDSRKLAYYPALLAASASVVLNLVTFLLEKLPVRYQMSGWPVPYGITICVDQFSITLSLLASALFFAVMVFSRDYITERAREFYSLFCIMAAGMLGLFHTGDIFNMYVFLEITSISSYALVAFRRTRSSLEAGIKYLIMGSFATSMIILGIALLYNQTGTLNIADMVLKINSQDAGLAAAFIFAGLALKAGLVPFHSWLPDAHPAAPSPISALLSGLAIKAGIYLFLRLWLTVFVGVSSVSWLLIAMGIISMVLGALLAMQQTDLKRLLAYSSVSQMGFIALCFGLANPAGFSAGINQVIQHALAKCLLFLVAGAVILKAGTRDMKEIGQKHSFGPMISVPFLMGSLAIAGIPLTGGFVSKWMVYTSTFAFSPALTIISLVVSALTFVYMMKAYSLVFAGGGKVHHFSKTMSWPLVCMAATIIILGVLPWTSMNLTDAIAAGISNVNNYIGAVIT
jgi:multicomponent Na+:H+ antiporter subunit D